MDFLPDTNMGDVDVENVVVEYVPLEESNLQALSTIIHDIVEAFIAQENESDVVNAVAVLDALHERLMDESSVAHMFKNHIEQMWEIVHTYQIMTEAEQSTARQKLRANSSYITEAVSPARMGSLRSGLSTFYMYFEDRSVLDDSTNRNIILDSLKRTIAGAEHPTRVNDVANRRFLPTLEKLRDAVEVYGNKINNNTKKGENLTKILDVCVELRGLLEGGAVGGRRTRRSKRSRSKRSRSKRSRRHL